MKTKFYFRLANLLSSALLLSALFFMVSPYFPALTYSIVRSETQTFEKNENPVPTTLPVNFRGREVSKKTTVEFVPGISTSKQKILTIPQIGVNGEIHEGDNTDLLKLGIWHLPWTGSPDKGGNTVLVAHRFLKTSGPDTFYFLDKLKVGDRFTLTWEGIVYNYSVTKSFVVPPTSIEIESPTAIPTLTLYTCTPLWSSTDRLVIRAELVN